jgi:signal transduction histidine kinase
LGVVSGSAGAGATSPTVWSLPPEPAVVAEVRERLHVLLTPSPQLDDVMLAASELVTNAVVHGEGDVVVSVWTVPGVRVEVADSGPGTPRLLTARGYDDESGRGLFIVDAVASRWGVLPKIPGPGKAVWFEVDVA